MRLTISVTPEDIKLGERYSPLCCPIGKALRRRLEQVFGEDQPFYGVASDRYVIREKYRKLPRVATAFVAAFDSRRPVAPIKFQITVDP